MADLDAELLALAGGDSSGEESMLSSQQRRSPSPKRPTKQPSPTDTGRKGSAQQARKARRRKDYSDDEESSASQRSESVNMSQSDSEAEFDPSQDKPIFPYEKLYYDAADKASILARPEIEREEILAQRSEQVDRHEQDLTLRRLLAARAKENAKTEARQKRKAAAAGLDDSQRKSSRQRTKVGGGRAGEASSAIEAYKQQRAEKTLRDEQRRSRPSARSTTPQDNDFSDGDAEAESDYEYNNRRNKRRSPSPPKDEPIAELVDIERARVGRDNFAQVCYTPGFEQAITGCYARVCLGPGRNPGTNEYRLCSIKKFTGGRPYAVAGSNGKPFLVDRYIVAAHGKAERSWSFLECSMSRFTEDEWRRYRIVMANENCKLPTKAEINSKLQQINQLLHHKFTDVQISEKVKRQTDLLHQVNRTAERKKIQTEIEDAMDAGNDEKVQELRDQLANIVPLKLAMNTSLHKPEHHFVNKDAERLAELNRRNQRLTAENVRKAQIAEMKTKKILKKQPAVAAIKDDLFGSDSDFSRAGTPANGAVATPEVGTPTSSQLLDGNNTNGTASSHVGPNGSVLQSVTVKPKRGLPVIRKAKRDDEILAEMDLGIEIDI